MKDTIEITPKKIIAQLSIVLEKKDDAYVGYIPSFDIPFTSPNKENASEIARGLVNALFTMWLKNGQMALFVEKLKKYKFNVSSFRTPIPT